MKQLRRWQTSQATANWFLRLALATRSMIAPSTYRTPLCDYYLGRSAKPVIAQTARRAGAAVQSPEPLESRAHVTWAFSAHLKSDIPP